MISVILPVYNASRYLDEAMQSVLNQTFKEFECICIDDGSTDDSLAILQKYEAEDSRVKVISRANKGLVATLNEGLELAQYDYIARMDADDICLPTRFEEQLNYLKQHPEFVLVGCQVDYIDENGMKYSHRSLSNSNFILNALLAFYPPFCHPAVLFNKGRLKDNLYYSDYEFAEDYELWARLSATNHPFSNVEKTLLQYRNTPSGVSNTNRAAQLRNMAQAMKTHLAPNLDVDKTRDYFLHGKHKLYFLYAVTFQFKGNVAIRLTRFLLFFYRLFKNVTVKSKGKI